MEPVKSTLVSREHIKIGTGGFSEVYEGKFGNVPCAIKVFDKNRTVVEKIEAELTIWAKLSDPSIVRFLGYYFEADDKSKLPSLILERMDISLTEYIKQNDPSEFYLSAKLDVLLKVAEGIRYIHDKSLIHGDLTANNVLLMLHGSYIQSAKISDFGMSRAIVSTVTQTFMAGKHLPPEVDEIPSHVSAKVDTYSFGILTLHLMIHQIPKPKPRTYLDYNSEGEKPIVRPRSEFERYEQYVGKIANEESNLIAFIKACLENNPDSRPDAIMLVQKLVELPRYPLKEQIQKYYNVLVSNLCSKEIVGDLFEKKIIGRDQQQGIQSQNVTTLANKILVDHLYQCGTKDTLRKLAEVLRTSQTNYAIHEKMAEVIDKILIQAMNELSLGKRVKEWHPAADSNNKHVRKRNPGLLKQPKDSFKQPLPQFKPLKQRTCRYLLVGTVTGITLFIAFIMILNLGAYERTLESWKMREFPVQEAARIGELKILSDLINSGYNPEEEDIVQGRTPLMVACETGNLAIAKILLDDFNVNVDKEDDHGYTALMIASYYGYFDLVKELSENYNADILHQNKKGKSVLHYACQEGHIRIIRYLMPLYGDKKFHVDKNGSSCLALAKWNSRSDVVAFLLKQGFKT